MSMKSSTLVKLAPWALTTLLFVLWELICISFKLPDYLLPAPSAVWASGHEYAGAIMQHGHANPAHHPGRLWPGGGRWPGAGPGRGRLAAGVQSLLPAAGGL